MNAVYIYSLLGTLTFYYILIINKYDYLSSRRLLRVKLAVVLSFHKNFICGSFDVSGLVVFMLTTLAQHRRLR